MVTKVEDALDKVSEYHIDLHNESIAMLMKMDLKGLTPNSFREGESSVFHPFLSLDNQTKDRMNTTMAVYRTKKMTFKNTDF